MEWQREIPVSTTVGEAYRLLRRIGHGLHGTVYEAQEQRLGRRCVIKVMNTSASSAEALARFHSQAEIATRLVHPHLVQVHDFGTAPGGEPFLVMEYLEGEDLARRQRRFGRFPPPFIAHIVKQIAMGLAALHAEGLAHLALKPTNVFVIPGNQHDPDFVKVLDFGTAQIENARTLDHPTMVEDTLPYVSPEQAGGSPEPLDARADQFALACIAWEMLTGRAPFGGKDPTALLYQIVYEDPLPITDLSLQLPPGLMQVLARGMDKRREHRFENILMFAEAFEQVTGPLVVAPPPAPLPQPLVQPSHASEPVFLPGLHHRGAEPPRRPTAPAGPRQTRTHDRRGQPPPVPMQQMPPEYQQPEVGPPIDHYAHVPPPVQVTPRPSRRWLLVGALPVAASIGLFVHWTSSRRKAQREADVDVERTTTTGAAPTAAAPAAAPGMGPEIVQLPTPAPDPKDARLRGKAARRARRAALRSKAKARRVKAPR
jgi:serine/threonine-protein kinase